ncbi:uncharacterized protein LOC121144120 [Mesocricetus auratus]|uniref:Uncharacterized protein LOC121144120 n=1 Tax=Mesocricetus auratus TaxID=10036 RepID=A0ABM2YF16_MESAU|nr:uncharacterized protein LOC121144120 [Mesocricetus auratus]
MTADSCVSQSLSPVVEKTVIVLNTDDERHHEINTTRTQWPKEETCQVREQSDCAARTRRSHPGGRVPRGPEAAAGAEAAAGCPGAHGASPGRRWTARGGGAGPARSCGALAFPHPRPVAGRWRGSLAVPRPLEIEPGCCLHDGSGGRSLRGGGGERKRGVPAVAAAAAAGRGAGEPRAVPEARTREPRAFTPPAPLEGGPPLPDMVTDRLPWLSYHSADAVHSKGTVL